MSYLSYSAKVQRSIKIVTARHQTAKLPWGKKIILLFVKRFEPESFTYQSTDSQTGLMCQTILETPSRCPIEFTLQWMNYTLILWDRALVLLWQNLIPLNYNDYTFRQIFITPRSKIGEHIVFVTSVIL